MIKTIDQVKITSKKNSFGKDKLFLYDLNDFDNKNEKLKLFSQAVLEVGEEVEYHMHVGEAETYYILSGKALYNDNGEISEIGPGTVTYTPSGSGHGIKNIGEDKLIFMALIILD
jgi:mannose-6-phosphate isomerase-like protein (cupin superfamily)